MIGVWLWLEEVCCKKTRNVYLFNSLLCTSLDSTKRGGTRTLPVLSPSPSEPFSCMNSKVCQPRLSHPADDAPLWPRGVNHPSSGRSGYWNEMDELKRHFKFEEYGDPVKQWIPNPRLRPGTGLSGTRYWVAGTATVPHQSGYHTSSNSAAQD